jgi:hypothetical protein
MTIFDTGSVYESFVIIGKEISFTKISLKRSDCPTVNKTEYWNLKWLLNFRS